MVRRFELHDPFAGDLLAVARTVEGLDDGRIIPVGFCFGARTVLAAADDLPRLGAVVLIAPPLHEEGTARFAARWNLWQFARRGFRFRVIRGMFDPASRRVYGKLAAAKWRRVARRSGGRPGPREEDDSWVSPQFLGPLARLIDRRVPMLVIYGEDDEEYREFRRARSGRLGLVLERAGSLIEVVVRPGRVHAFDDASVQDALTGLIVDWLRPRATLPAPTG
jgi:pimeloyl-ACP methyl ester carboxylesterase